MNHIEHFEDLLFVDEFALESLLNNYIATRAHTSTKWDGSPAVLVGRDADGFFVATKQWFNKTPVAYYTLDSIANSGLKDELFSIMVDLWDAYEGCRDQFLEGYTYQGDFLWGYSEEPTKSFQPNTIVYELYDQPAPPGIGIVWHTRYIDRMPTSFAEPPIGDGVWSPPPCLNFIANAAVARSVTDTLDMLRSTRKYTKPFRDFIRNEPELLRFSKRFLREGAVDMYKAALFDFIMEQANSKKTAVAKARWANLAVDATSLLKDAGNMFRKEYEKLSRLKWEILLHHLHMQGIRCYLKREDGSLEYTTHEGIVLFDGRHAAKLVPIAFSQANRSSKYLKGFDHKRTETCTSQKVSN